MTFMIPAAVDVADLKETTLLNMGIFGLFVAVTMIIVTATNRAKMPMFSRVVSLRSATFTAGTINVISLPR